MDNRKIFIFICNAIISLRWLHFKASIGIMEPGLVLHDSPFIKVGGTFGSEVCLSVIPLLCHIPPSLFDGTWNPLDCHVKFIWHDQVPGLDLQEGCTSHLN